MSYRVEIGGTSPKTFTPTSEAVIELEINRSANPHNMDTAQMMVYDKKWDLFSALPDPVFEKVPLKIYLQKPGESEGARPTRLVFDGIVASLQPSYPAVSQLMIVAHDQSHAVRANASYKTLRGKTSIQLCQEIAKLYALDVDVSELQDIATLKNRAIEIGAGGVGSGYLSDWNHIARALAVDGLRPIMRGNKITIIKLASKVYPTEFKRDDGKVISFQPQINHVGVGRGGKTLASQPGGNSGTVQGLTGPAAQEASKTGVSNATHRRIPSSPNADANTTHPENVSSISEKAKVERVRKDDAALTLVLHSDIELTHKLKLTGWSTKTDTTKPGEEWLIESIQHRVSGSSGHRATMLKLKRGASASSKQKAGLPPSPAASATG